VSGDTVRAGVGEFPMGAPVREIVDELGGGVAAGRRVAAVMSGVANGLLDAPLLDTPASHEALQAVGSGLGAAGFLVFDDETDFGALAAGVARFLSVESCGQCTPCKQDGGRIRDLLAAIVRSEPRGEADGLALVDIDRRLRDVTESARCGLAEQQQRVLTSIRERWSTHWVEHADGTRPPVEPMLVAPIDDIVDGRAVLDARQADKQPDWTFDPVDSGEAPADRYGEGRPHRYPVGVVRSA
jgi:NADH:ubiquinone oxidoreductase subunit F (NADH-binding)